MTADLLQGITLMLLIYGNSVILISWIMNRGGEDAPELNGFESGTNYLTC